MTDVRSQLLECFKGRLCLMGLGNTDYGDDGFGVRLAKALPDGLPAKIVVAENNPERYLASMNGDSCDDLIFIDAVECGALPGSVVFLHADEIASRFPQVSTHKVALSTLAQWARAGGVKRTWLLGAQPASLAPGVGLSPRLEQTVSTLTELLTTVSEEVQACL